MICTGDIVAEVISDGMAFWNEVGVDSFLNVIGNHDEFATMNPVTFATSVEVYNTFIKPYLSSWGNVVQPSNAETNGLSYYYKDYSTSKVRLIVLDQYDKGNASYLTNQNTWFQGVLADAITNGYSVLCAIHATNGDMNGFDCTFNTLQETANSTFEESLYEKEIWKNFIKNMYRLILR